MAVLEGLVCGLSSFLCLHFLPAITDIDIQHDDHAPLYLPSNEGYGSIRPSRPYAPQAPQVDDTLVRHDDVRSASPSPSLADHAPPADQTPQSDSDSDSDSVDLELTEQQQPESESASEAESDAEEPRPPTPIIISEVESHSELHVESLSLLVDERPREEEAKTIPTLSVHHNYTKSKSTSRSLSLVQNPSKSNNKLSSKDIVYTNSSYVQAVESLVQYPLVQEDLTYFYPSLSTTPETRALRVLAHTQGHYMRRCFEETQVALLLGQPALAQLFWSNALMYKSRMDKFNMLASIQIFQERNPDPNSDEIDLHGLFVAEAIAVVEDAIFSAICRSVLQMRFIVGKGLHSKGCPKLRPAIERLVEKKHFDSAYDPHNSGALVVSLRRGRRVDIGYRA